MYWRAAATDAGRPWKSTMMSTSGPTVSRRVDMSLSTCRRCAATVRCRSVGDDDDFECVVTLFDDGGGLLTCLSGIGGVVHRAHVAEAEVGVDAHRVAGLATEQAPDRLTDRLAEDVPQRVFDATDRRRADDAEAVIAVLGQHPHDLLDVAGVAADDQRRQVFDRAKDGSRLPVQAGLAPTVEAVLVGADLHQDPVPQLGVDDGRLDGSDVHSGVLSVSCGVGHATSAQ